MTRLAYYNEIDAFCCDVLRARVADGSLPPGDVDERDIRTVDPNELRGYGQVHLFAGIGGGALACRLAGVPDEFRIITAGVPCQPASQAGKRLGAQDERWLWPEFFRVLRALRSHYSLVEQPPGVVSLNDGAEWEWILGELADIVPSYAVSRVSAGAVGAPQQRDRLWIVADADPEGRLALRESERARLEGASGHVAPRCDEGVVDAAGERLPSRGVGIASREAARGGERRSDARNGCASVGDADGGRRGSRGVCGPGEEEEERQARRSACRSDGTVGDSSSGGRREGSGQPVRRAGGGCEGVGDTNSAGREEFDAAAEPDGSRHAVGECLGMGQSGRGSVQHRDDARSARGERREDEGEGLQRERSGRDARDYGELLRPWSDAVAVRGADGTVRLIPKEAAEAGPESPLWPVANGIPGRVARLRAIGNAWVPQAAVPALRVILARHDREAVA